jgi:hypothetical protein
MAAPRGKAMVTPKEPARFKELPSIRYFGITQTPNGFVVVSVTVRGTEVLEHEVLSEPEHVAHATQRAQGQLVAEYLKPKVGA